MSILGIANRTENWMTVNHFYGLSEEAKACLVQKLSGTKEPPSSKVDIELFWKGMRDYLNKTEGPNERCFRKLAKSYERLFPELRKKVEGFVDRKLFRVKLNDHHYKPSGEKGKDNLGNNLVGTEIDIVIATSDYLFIGEAKHESKFSAVPKYVLVHQLIRQYVMAKILVKILCSEKKVVPFVVGDCAEKLKRYRQVQFMKEQGWLKEENILTWDCIKALTRNP